MEPPFLVYYSAFICWPIVRKVLKLVLDMFSPDRESISIYITRSMREEVSDTATPDCRDHKYVGYRENGIFVIPFL